MRKMVEGYDGKKYRVVEKIGYYSMNSWRTCGKPFEKNHALDMAVGAMEAGRLVSRARTSENVYSGLDGMLYAVNALEAWQVEEVA